MTIQTSLAKKLSNKIQEQVGHRVDLSVADFYKMTPTSARFMLEFDSNKKPASEEITDFFVRQYNGKIMPDLTTAKVIPSESVIVVVASMINYNRPIADSSKMKQVIAGYSYFDEKLQESWDVKEINGQKVLSRKIRDDIGSIVEARRKVMMNKSTKKTFASLKATASNIREVTLVDAGDLVTAYHNGRQYENCEVTKVNASDVELRYGDKSFRVDRSALLDVTAKSESVAVQDEQKLIDYFSKAYGNEEYARKLVKGS